MNKNFPKKQRDVLVVAGVDDGCGVCGQAVTKTVVVKDCADCVKDK